jgi:hypothetical protein
VKKLSVGVGCLVQIVVCFDTKRNALGEKSIYNLRVG